MNWLPARATSVSSTPPSMPMTTVGETLPNLSRSSAAGPPRADRSASNVVIEGMAGSVSVPNGSEPESPIAKLMTTRGSLRSSPPTSTPGAMSSVARVSTNGSPGSGSETVTVVTSPIPGAPGSRTAARSIRSSAFVPSSTNPSSTCPSSLIVDPGPAWRPRKPRLIVLPEMSATASTPRVSVPPGTRNTCSGACVERPIENAASRLASTAMLPPILTPSAAPSSPRSSANVWSLISACSVTSSSSSSAPVASSAPASEPR